MNTSSSGILAFLEPLIYSAYILSRLPLMTTFGRNPFLACMIGSMSRLSVLLGILLMVRLKSHLDAYLYTF